MASHFFKRVVTSLSSITAGAALFAAMAAPVHAQSGTIRLLVGFPAGGGTDVIARTLAEKLKDQLGANVIVEKEFFHPAPLNGPFYPGCKG